MIVPIHQKFSFNFEGKELKNQDTKLIEFECEMIWTGENWEIDIETIPTNQYLPEKTFLAAKSHAQTKINKLLKENGFEIPNPSPITICLNSAYQPDPEKILEDIHNEPLQTQILDEQPTPSIIIQDEILLQLWSGTQKEWKKGQEPVITTWTEWRPVPILSTT